MIVKKRDIYILTLLCSIVGYAACQRISEGSKSASEQIRLTTTARDEMNPMPRANNPDAADDAVILTDTQDPGRNKILSGSPGKTGRNSSTGTEDERTSNRRIAVIP